MERRGEGGEGLCLRCSRFISWLLLQRNSSRAEGDVVPGPLTEVDEGLDSVGRQLCLSRCLQKVRVHLGQVPDHKSMRILFLPNETLRGPPRSTQAGQWLSRISAGAGISCHLPHENLSIGVRVCMYGTDAGPFCIQSMTQFHSPKSALLEAQCPGITPLPQMLSSA